VACHTDKGENAGVPRWAAAAPSGGPAGLPWASPEGSGPSTLVDALDLALARQEVLAAANSSHPLARAIILHLAATLGVKEPNDKAR
jgi:hypothetical protein